MFRTQLGDHNYPGGTRPISRLLTLVRYAYAVLACTSFSLESRLNRCEGGWVTTPFKPCLIDKELSVNHRVIPK